MPDAPAFEAKLCPPAELDRRLAPEVGADFAPHVSFADLVEALGIVLDPGPEVVARSIRETGFGLRDLTVVLLDVEKDAYPAFSSGELAGKPASELQGLAVHRLGSAVSDARGRFAIDYTFEIEGRPEVTADGKVRIRTLSIQAFDVKVGDMVEKEQTVAPVQDTAADDPASALVVRVPPPRDATQIPPW